MSWVAAAVGLGSAAAGAYAAKKDNKTQNKSLALSEKQREESLKFIQQMLSQSRGDLFTLFPQAQQTRNQGLLAGVGLQQQAFPQIMNSFQGGNVGAQKMLLAGLPQMQNAILGRPVDLSGLSAQTLPQPTAFTLPNYSPQFQMPSLLGGTGG